MIQQYTLLDLFSGIGMFSLGLEKSGLCKTVAFCEIDKECHKVLNKHWPNVTIYDDIKKLVGKDIIDKHGPIDVICGGSPCQDISVAGKKVGFIDENGELTRSGLWFEMFRIIKEIKPRYVIFENVSNIRSKGLSEVLQNFSEIGYSCEWNVFSARQFGGPHLRERLFLVAYPNTYSYRLEKNPNDGLLFGKRHTELFNLYVPKMHMWNEPPPSKTEFCGVGDGNTTGLDNIRLKHRIKQCGNSIVHIIPQFIGHAILELDNQENYNTNTEMYDYCISIGIEANKALQIANKVKTLKHVE